MPAITTLSLNDGTTDVAFNPTGINQVGTASFRDLSGGVASVAPVATLSGTTNSAAHSVKGKVNIPLSTLDDGGRTIALGENMIGNFDLRIPHVATDVEAAILYSQLKDFLADALVSAMITNRDSMY